MLKAPMFLIVCLGSRTGADRSERWLRQKGRKRRRMSASCSPWRPARGGNQSQPAECHGAAIAAPFVYCLPIVRGSMAITRSCTIFKVVSSSFFRWSTVFSISWSLRASRDSALE